MMNRLLRRFRAEKYVFEIHLIRIHPWVKPDKLVGLSWQRGVKKRGETGRQRSALSQVPSEKKTYVLGIDHVIKLDVTLYAKKGKMRGEGHYDNKELMFEIKEFNADGSVFSSLGKVTLHLNNRVAATDDGIIYVPITRCAEEIRNEVDVPYLEMTIHCRPS